MNEDIRKFLENQDFEGMARAFEEGGVQWHAAEWERFISIIRSKVLEDVREIIKTQRDLIVLEDGKVYCSTGKLLQALQDYEEEKK